MKRITIIAGHYGSGKSEISTHLAFHNDIDVFVDLDIINPYFRTRALDQEFEARGIQLIESTLKGMKNSDMPYVSGAAAVPFVNSNLRAIYDLGGTENGGRVLIQFVDRIQSLDDIDLLYVVNIFRPETDSVEKIIAAIKRLESEAQLSVTGLINNTNLMKHTTLDDVLAGQEILKTVGAELQLPICYTVIEEHHHFDHPFAGDLIQLQRLVANKWL